MEGKASSQELKMVERSNRMAMWRRILAVGPVMSLAVLPAHFSSPTHASSTYSLTKMHSWLLQPMMPYWNCCTYGSPRLDLDVNIILLVWVSKS